MVMERKLVSTPARLLGVATVTLVPVQVADIDSGVSISRCPYSTSHGRDDWPCKLIYSTNQCLLFVELQRARFLYKHACVGLRLLCCVHDESDATRHLDSLL